MLRWSEESVPEPRDHTLDPISAPLVTTYSLKALIDSPQFRQTIILPSGRTVSYTACGSKTGTPVVYFYGLGGSSRQLASIHAQAVRLDIKLLCVDRPGTGFTDPFKPPSNRRQKHKEKPSKDQRQSIEVLATASAAATTANDRTDDCRRSSDDHSNISSPAVDIDSGNDTEQLEQRKSHTKSIRRSFTRDRKSRAPNKAAAQQQQQPSANRKLNERLHHTCLETLAVIDHLLPGARFGLMGHSCGIYYIMHMVNLFPDRIRPGPISLLTPWVPFNECPNTTSSTFKFLKHVPRGLVWAVTSSMNHLGSMIMSSSNALSGTLSSRNSNGSSDDEQESTTTTGGRRRDKRRNRDGNNNASDDEDGNDELKRPADPFILQFSDAFDKVVLPALVHDMNRQHSNGYNSEIQMSISDVGFDLASIPLPEGVTINAYCGYLDNVVPIEASYEMGQKCGWEMHEFRYSGHGGPRMSMYALEDYALAIQTIAASKVAEEQLSEMQAD
ncbi:hypothetical protein BC939DRAFT_463920 [Gamsiella multidivaricata]|uniref:uncharacterized protein n=1 Tax=Gamsiella multidivaricata TaxID=101098 RepID=UPI002220A497|nr:uncharacterized protein BC939DRAFT_463920 [Gamsiella multidivaricata]KAG0363787.1 hypothetical protein BGZ54_008045 [Gamsiella multidivaricata]KAI7818068.1 hypothetical protein BC939DRAFT_463920 [Gamsiella multidivaricata]